MSADLFHPGEYLIGGIVSIPVAIEIVGSRRVLVSHKGILSDRMAGGAPLIWHASKFHGAVVLTDVEGFMIRGLDGHLIRYDGYPGGLPQLEVLSRAASQAGRKYDLLRWNCEDYSQWCHGLPPQSPQRRHFVSGLVGLKTAG